MGFVPSPIRDILKRTRLWVGIAFFFIGLAIFSTTEGAIEDLGLALAVAMVVAIATDALIGEAILARVDESVRRVTDALREVPILRQAEASGVHGILMRLSPSSTEMFEAIEAQLRSGEEELRLLGVACPSLFCGEGRDRFGQWMSGSTVGARIILLDDASDWAAIRQKLETGHSTAEDIRSATLFLNGQDWSNKIELKSTDIPLPAFVVITDEWVFIEPYPIALVKRQLGGRTPMLKLKSGSNGYNIWSETFEFIWKYPRMEHLNVYDPPPNRHQQPR